MPYCPNPAQRRRVTMQNYAETCVGREARRLAGVRPLSATVDESYRVFRLRVRNAEVGGSISPRRLRRAVAVKPYAAMGAALAILEVGCASP